jgi:hypothetical protein
MERDLENAYGMTEQDYMDYNDYLDGDDLANFNANEADDYRDEGMDDFDPSEYEASDEADMYGGFDDFDEYTGGEY